MNRTIIVFVDGVRVESAANGTALDAVRASSAERASEVENGTLVITDSRGLPVSNDTRVHGGAIFRVIANRAGAAEADEDAPLEER